MKPNILFFFTDDQRFDTIAALGNDEIITPNLDALVARGATFTRAHIPGGTCGAVCMPSRAMLHTGRTLFHLDNMGESIPTDHTTMGECFRAAGYETFGTGKWHNGKASYARSFSCGDEIFFGGMGDHWNVPAYHFDPAGRYDGGFPFVQDPGRSNAVSHRPCDHMHLGRHSTELFRDAALAFLKGRDETRPFFAYVSLMAPHDPRTMPQRFLDMYDPAEIRLPESFLPEHPIDTGALRIRDEILAAFPRDPDEIRRHIAEYYAMITHLDHAFGRIMKQIEKRGLAENTIVVFAGDNGLAVGRHGLMGKQNLYDHSVRVPLIFAGPGIPAGVRTDAHAYLLDVFPTLCDLAGLDAPASVEGMSLAPCIADASLPGREDMYLVYEGTIRGVTDGAHKLIEYAAGDTQFFELAADPHEMHNLADAPDKSDVLAALRQRLIVLRNEWDDQAHWSGQKFWQTRPDLDA